MVKRASLAAAVLAIVVFLALNLPPARRNLERTFDDGTVSGILHVHSSRSDGSGTPDEVAAAAARAGAAFVIFTDHGDATRSPAPPAYRSGVLCLDAVEISTRGGHYIALDMPAAPYPLGGEARDVVEDVARLGGFGVAAHPDSPDPELAWRDSAAPVDGVEWLNLDTSWRINARAPGWRSRWRLIELLAAYPFRPAETIARVTLDTPSSSARRAALARTRRVVMLAGADAHGELPLVNGEVGARLPIPGYESVFRALSLHVLIDGALTGNASDDAATLMTGIRHGRVYMAVDGLAGKPAFRFTATNAHASAVYGGKLPAAGAVTLRVASNAPSSFTTVLLKDERPLASAPGHIELTQSVPDAPAVYRVEIRPPSHVGTLPWLVSNPIYSGVTFPAASPAPAAPVTTWEPIFDGRTTAGWKTESDVASRGTLRVTSGSDRQELVLDYAMSVSAEPRPYLALVAAASPPPATDHLAFIARTVRPSRISVSVRDHRGEQWTRSVYLDATPREHLIPLAEMRPAGKTTSPRPAGSEIREVLFVFETTHNEPGSAGQLRIASAALQVRGSSAQLSDRRR